MFGVKLNLKDSEKSLQQQAEQFGQRLLQKLFGVTLNWEKQRDIINNNYELGLRHFKLGNISDAVFRFRLTTWLDDKHADAWYWLGRSYVAEGKLDKAREALGKAQALKPDHAEARYFMAVAGGNKDVALPLGLVLESFELPPQPPASPESPLPPESATQTNEPSAT